MGNFGGFESEDFEESKFGFAPAMEVQTSHIVLQSSVH